MTGWLVKFMNQMQNLPIVQMIRAFNKNPCDLQTLCTKKTLAWLLFAYLVKAGAQWDIKIEMKAQLGPDVVIGGMWFEYSTPGNIAYGFLGAAMGFSKAEIAIGAGGAQAYDYGRGCGGDTPCEIGPIAANPRPIGRTGPGPMLPDIWPLGDTVDDAYAVRLGYELYGTTGGRATVSALTVAISARAHGMALRSLSTPAENALDISSSSIDRFDPRSSP